MDNVRSLIKNSENFFARYSRKFIRKYFKSIKRINYFNLKNTYFEIIRKLFCNKLIIKQKRLLINSFNNDSLTKRIFGENIDYNRVRLNFFNSNLFAYWNLFNRKEIKKLINEEFPLQIEKIVKYADDILKGRIQIFDVFYVFEENINWHYSFLGDLYWELKGSDKINIYEDNEGKDVKYVWELNRHQFLPYLGLAYYLTKDEKYTICFKNIILDWINKNPPLWGINWYSGLEISLRLISWIFSLYFFNQSKIINENSFFEKIFRSMVQHAYYLNFFYTRRSFNHTLGELFGLFLFSEIFKQFPLIKKWRDKSYKRFFSQIFIQSREDGTSIEQSLNYHKFALEFFLLFYFINKKKINASYKYRLEKIFEFLLMTIKPNKTFPHIGDSDDSKVLILTSHKKVNYKDILIISSILLNGRSIDELIEKKTLISVLLLGTKAHRLNNSYLNKKTLKKIAYFPKGGYLIARNNWNVDSNYLFINYSRFGPQMAPHSHSDIFNVIFSCKGKDIFIDSGTYSYNKTWEKRKKFTSASSHNVLVINHMNQANLIDYFYWIKKPKVYRKFKINNKGFYLKGLHNGYEGFIVKREIISNITLKKIEIIDTVFPRNINNSQNLSDIRIFFHLNAKLNVKINGLTIMIDELVKISFYSDLKLELSLQKDVFSPFYGIKNENNIIILKPINSDKYYKKYPSIRTEILTLN